MEIVVVFIFAYSIIALAFGIYCLIGSNKKIKVSIYKEDKK